MNSSLLEYAAAMADKLTFPSKKLISMFIYGPTKSLKSTICMDMAVCITESAVCQICGEINGNCDCCFFVMIKSVKKRTGLEFPLACYHRDERSMENPFGEVPNQRERRTWSEKTLRHIKIKYMDNFSDVIRFLASVQLISPNLRPQLGIMIDDIESFLETVGHVEESECNADGKNKLLGDGDDESRNQNTPTKKRNTFPSNEKTVKLLQIMALVRDTVSSQSVFPKGLHFVGCIDSDTIPVTKPVISMVQNFIPFSVKIKRCADLDTSKCARNDSRSCWEVEFSPIISVYGPMHICGSTNFKVKYEVIEEKWFDEGNSYPVNSFSDCVTHRLVWW